jgi:hypothetical protein
MTNTLEMYDDEGNLIAEEQEPKFARLPRDVINRLEEEAKAGRDAIAKNAAMERELAFSRAGVDPSHPAAVYFTRAYDGEVDPEAIKAKWAEVAGVTGGAVQTQQQADDELAQIRAAAAVTTGGLADIPTNRLAERDAKLKELLDGPPSLAKERKFQEILDEYGTTMAP